METKRGRCMSYIPYIGLVVLPKTTRIEYLLKHKPIVPKEYTTLKKVIITTLVVILSGLFGLLFRVPELPTALGGCSAIVMVFVWIVQGLRITACRERLFSWSCAVYDEYCRHTQPKQPIKPRRYWTANEITKINF